MVHGIKQLTLFKQFLGKYKYIGIYGKPKAHSLVSGRVVAPPSRVRTLVLGIRVTYMRNNYKNVNFKAHNKLLVIISHTLLKMDN